MSAPQTTIYICSGIPLNSRYEHSLYFASRDEQQEFFSGQVDKTLTAYSYVRCSWPLKVEATMEEALTWNYLFFRNSRTSKLYYYFIENIEYINESTVQLTLEMDVLQTYLFDFGMLPCFIERQHTTSDEIGEHTVDEGLETGPLVINSEADVDLSDLCILVLSAITLNGVSEETTIPALSFVYNNVFSGLNISAVDIDDWQLWEDQLEKLSEWGKIDGIVAMWMYPKDLVMLGGEAEWGDDTLAKPVLRVKDKTVGDTPNVWTIDGYEPKNNKLFCYPYHFLYATNNNGGGAVYKYEFFKNQLADFYVSGALSPDAGAKLIPLDYNGSEDNFDEGLTLPGFPTCAWDADIYKIWCAQNQNTHNLTQSTGLGKAVVGAAAALGSLAMGNVLGAAGGAGTAISGIMSTQTLLAQKADMEVQPPQARGAYSASINLANDRHTFTLMEKSVCAEYARIIDDYFTKYGYQINRVGSPNIHARETWTYIKTIGCHIRGFMCNEDICKIESIFDAGITWWADPANVGNYYMSNDPI